MKSLVSIILIFLSFPLFAQVEKPSEFPPFVFTNTSNAPIRKEPNHSSEIISRIPSNTKLDVIEAIDEYIFVKYDSTKGFISVVFLKSDSLSFKVYLDYVNDIRNQERVQNENEENEKRNERLKIEHAEKQKEFEKRKEELKKKYGDWAGERIANKTIWIGMTEEMLLDSWGYPLETNRTVTPNLVRKQFVYPNYKYVYTDNGKVSAWQD